MATFIKAGFWQRLCNPCEGYEGWLNLDWLINTLEITAEWGDAELDNSIQSRYFTLNKNY
jgi:hypothetical protein